MSSMTAGVNRTNEIVESISCKRRSRSDAPLVDSLVSEAWGPGRARRSVSRYDAYRLEDADVSRRGPMSL